MRGHNDYGGEVDTWPEPVERVAAVLRAAAVDARVEEFADETPSAGAAETARAPRTMTAAQAIRVPFIR